MSRGQGRYTVLWSSDKHYSLQTQSRNSNNKHSVSNDIDVIHSHIQTVVTAVSVIIVIIIIKTIILTVIVVVVRLIYLDTAFSKCKFLN